MESQRKACYQGSFQWIDNIWTLSNRQDFMLSGNNRVPQALERAQECESDWMCKKAQRTHLAVGAVIQGLLVESVGVVESVGIAESEAGGWGTGWGHIVSTLNNKLKSLEFILQLQMGS